MNEKALRTLEFDKIVKMLKDRAVSPMGKAAAAALTPSDDLDDIRLRQRETSDASAMILKRGSIPLGGLSDIGPFIKRAAVGGSLSISELLAVGDFLYVVRKVLKYAHEETRGEAASRLMPLFEGLAAAPSLEKEIERCIISDTEVADDASPALRDVRRGMKTSNERVREQLNSIIHSQAYKGMLSDTVITIRSGRYCVPVRQEFRSSFPGMVHDQSQSGATFFMEPMSVVALNNKIKELLAQEKAEIDKILARLSAAVAENAQIMEDDLETLTLLDFAFAKGELSLAMNATEPVFNDKGIINIKKGRHPLLDPKTVVPTDIYVGTDFDTLLITGPNTGGKTVSLKTLGLFALMGQAGLHIAAFDNSELSLFDEVFADIGDEQSIEQSLSTFSSHMTNIVDMLREVTPRSLVLLDELGAGTDPTEGAALAIAILRHLRARGVITAVTTHYSELKLYALSTDGVENASCEFDVATLRPTYRLLIGVPGKSNAFAISQKLGLPGDVIDMAREALSHESARFEDVITDLEISRKTALIEQERAEQYRREAEKAKEELDKQKDKLAAQREKLLSEARNEARLLMQRTKDEADALMKQFRKELSGASHKGLENTRASMRESLEKLEQDVSQARAPKSLRPAPKSLHKGDKVFIHTLNQSGVVSSPPDANGDVYVSAGIMKVRVNMNDLSLDESEETVKVGGEGLSHRVKASKSMSVSPEVDLRGMTVDEALEKTDKYLDDAWLSSLSQVTIIHGKGTGALRSAISSYLRGHPQVKSHRPGAHGEGDAGVTVVELKK